MAEMKMANTLWYAVFSNATRYQCTILRAILLLYMMDPLTNFELNQMNVIMERKRCKF